MATSTISNPDIRIRQEFVAASAEEAERVINYRKILLVMQYPGSYIESASYTKKQKKSKGEVINEVWLCEIVLRVSELWDEREITWEDEGDTGSGENDHDQGDS